MASPSRPRPHLQSSRRPDRLGQRRTDANSVQYFWYQPTTTAAPRPWGSRRPPARNGHSPRSKSRQRVSGLRCANLCGAAAANPCRQVERRPRDPAARLHGLLHRIGPGRAVDFFERRPPRPGIACCAWTLSQSTDYGTRRRGIRWYVKRLSTFTRVRRTPVCPHPVRSGDAAGRSLRRR